MTSRSKKYFDVKNMSKNIKRFRKGIPNSDVFALCNRIKYDLVKISAERTRKDYFVDLSDLGIKKLGQ